MRRGTGFENAYCASPLCVPARASLATGRFPHQTGYWDSSMAYDGRFDSWMKRLREAGYESTGIGKMHFRSDSDDYGFDRLIDSMHIADGVGDLVSALRYSGEEPLYQGLWKLWTSRYGAGDQDPYRQYDERIIEEAIGALRGSAGAGGKPWALSVHFIAAHAPFVVPQRFLDLYDPRDIPPPIRFVESERPVHPSITHLRNIVCHQADMPLEHVQRIRAHYFATVSYLDDLIGRLLTELDNLGLAETTRVIYTSDHGFSCGEHYIFGLFHLLEESLGVPLIMAGPGIPGDRVIDQAVSHVDLYPTILESCGMAGAGKDRDPGGKSLWPIITGETRDHGPVYAEYHATGTLSAGYVVRSGAMKLIYFVGMPAQLFDLSIDPDESTDLAQDPRYLATLDKLLGALRNWVDPQATDREAKRAQKNLVEQHGGKEIVLADKAGFSYSPPPGMDWRSVNDPE